MTPPLPDTPEPPKLDEQNVEDALLIEKQQAAFEAKRRERMNLDYEPESKGSW